MNKPQPTLSQEQIAALKPYEGAMGQVIRANYCSVMRLSELDLMLNIWNAVTNTRRPYRPGCMDCAVSLIRDVGTLYFSQTGIDPWSLVEKKIYSHGSLVKTITPSPAPAVEAKAAATSKATTKKKTAATAKKTAKKK